MAADRIYEAFHHIPGHAELHSLASELLLPRDCYFLEEHLRSWVCSDAAATAFAEFERDFLVTASDAERGRLPLIDGDTIKEYRLLTVRHAPRRPGQWWPPRKGGWTAGHHAMWFCSRLHELTLRGLGRGWWPFLRDLEGDELLYGDALGRVLEFWVAAWEHARPPPEVPFAVSQAEVLGILDDFDSDEEDVAGDIIAYGDQVRRRAVGISSLGHQYDPADQQPGPMDDSSSSSSSSSSMGSGDDSDWEPDDEDSSDDGNDSDDEEPDEDGEPCSKTCCYSRPVSASEPAGPSPMDEPSDYDSDDDSFYDDEW